MIQGSDEWLKARAGKVTCSRLKDVLATVKSGEAAGRRNYRIQLVTERLTGLPVETYKNIAMQHGTDTEPFARMAYEALTGHVVGEVGLIDHPDHEWLAGSPDGLVDDDGLIEIKCPYVSTVHVETLISQDLPSEHIPQIQGLLWVTGRQWLDFISFDPRMPDYLRLFVKRVYRDEKYIERMKESVTAFLGEIEQMVHEFRKRAA